MAPGVVPASSPRYVTTQSTALFFVSMARVQEEARVSITKTDSVSRLRIEPSADILLEEKTNVILEEKPELTTYIENTSKGGPTVSETTATLLNQYATAFPTVKRSFHRWVA